MRVCLFLLTTFIQFMLVSCNSENSVLAETESTTSAELLSQQDETMDVEEYLIEDESEIAELEIVVDKISEMDGIALYDHHYMIDFARGEASDDMQPFENRLYVDIHYPQIEGVADSGIQNSINEIFKMALFEIVSSDYNEVLAEYAAVMKWPKDKEDYRYMYLSGEYQILSFRDDFISIWIKNELAFGAGRSWDTDYSITIDLNSGKKVDLADYAGIDSIEAAILAGNYTIAAGESSDTTYGIKNDKVNFSNELSVQFLESFERSNIVGSLLPPQTRAHNSNNFGIDNEYIYIGFTCEYAIDGYLILAISQQDIEHQ